MTLLKKFNWKRVAILVQQDHIFTKVNLIFNFFSLEKVVLAIERLDFDFLNSLINKRNPDRDVTVFGHPSLQFSLFERTHQTPNQCLNTFSNTSKNIRLRFVFSNLFPVFENFDVVKRGLSCLIYQFKTSWLHFRHFHVDSFKTQNVNRTKLTNAAVTCKGGDLIRVLGPVSRKPRKAILDHLYLKTEKCIRLKLLV